MRYYKRVLQPNETVLFLGHLHWLVNGRGLILMWVGIIALFAAKLVPSIQTASWLPIGAILVFAWSFLSLSISAVQRRTTEIVVTDRRVIYKTGLLSRRTMEMNVGKIETVDVLQGFVGRMMSFGAVLIRGTGASFEPLERVASPLALRNAILVG